jgi:hypothetical protein
MEKTRGGVAVTKFGIDIMPVPKMAKNAFN